MTVLRDTPSRVAVREMFQPESVSAASRWSRITSRDEGIDGPDDAVTGWMPGATLLRARCASVRTEPSESNAARSIAFDSSRTFPGH